MGNRTGMTDANGHATSYSYDAMNRLTGVTDAAGGTVAYVYDAVGNRLSMTDANGHVTGYSYDSLNRLVSTTDPLGNVTSQSYDAVGNRTGTTKADGAVLTYSYDNLDRLASIAYGSDSISFSYDAVGNRTQMIDPTGVTSYSYDDLDRLTQVSGPNGVLGYAYDASGNRTTLTYPGSDVVSYSYDAADRLTGVTDWASRATTYGYDGAGRPTAIGYPNGVSAAYGYDAAGRLLSLAHSAPDTTVIAEATYTLDPVGNRLSMVDTDGASSYSYDSLDRLTRVVYPDGEQVDYAYDPMGNRLSLTSSVQGVTTYTYDAGDRLLSVTDPGGTTSLTWDANGNLATKGAESYTFDALDRLTQVVDGATSVAFSYDGDGVRLGKSVNGTATGYLQDIGAPLPIVLIETTGGQSSRYVYGADLLALVDPAGVPSYYHTDGLGSTRALSNASAQRTDAYSYDVFGAVRTQTGSTQQDFQHTGEQIDPELGLIFLRARYYDPDTGRFLSRDPWPGLIDELQSQNDYLYVKNNPVRFVDPSGKIAVVAVVGVALLAYGTYVTIDGFIDLSTKKYDAYVEAKRAYYDIDTYTDENMDQRRNEVLLATADLYNSAADVAINAQGTTLTGPLGVPQSWLALTIRQSGKIVTDTLFPLESAYRANIYHALGIDQTESSENRREYMQKSGKDAGSDWNGWVSGSK